MRQPSSRGCAWRLLLAGVVQPALAAGSLEHLSALEVGLRPPAPEPLLPGEYHFPPYLPLSNGDDPPTLAPPEALEILARSALAAAQRAKTASSEAMAAAGEVSARISAEDAEGVAEDARALGERASRASAQLREALARERSAEVGSTKAARSVVEAYEQAQAYLQHLPDIAASVVGEAGISNKLAPVYKGLQEWKMKVLHNRLLAGRQKGIQAAMPLENAVMSLERRVGADRQQAAGLAKQANVIRGEAVRLASAAAAKQAMGDTGGASVDMATAQRMVSQANWMDSRGKELEQAADEHALRVPAYAAAASRAHQKAMHRFVPNLVPPPPFDVTALAPLPPVNVLAQKGRSVKRR